MYQFIISNESIINSFGIIITVTISLIALVISFVSYRRSVEVINISTYQTSDGNYSNLSTSYGVEFRICNNKTSARTIQTVEIFDPDGININNLDFHVIGSSLLGKPWRSGCNPHEPFTLAAGEILNRAYYFKGNPKKITIRVTSNKAIVCCKKSIRLTVDSVHDDRNA